VDPIFANNIDPRSLASSGHLRESRNREKSQEAGPRFTFLPKISVSPKPVCEESAQTGPYGSRHLLFKLIRLLYRAAREKKTAACSHPSGARPRGLDSSSWLLCPCISSEGEKNRFFFVLKSTMRWPPAKPTPAGHLWARFGYRYTRPRNNSRRQQQNEKKSGR